ncbi:hypothetical protein ACFQ1E_03675 [Sphingomonas canadensis]|uniref:DUF2029 domain-containing protein n=1 Tax=Sphingomonas canadensis TaxID=1219257 RepID=A0ABW3H2R8_9SPHN|nr:hypothetical protein [Sphingomonas canadensis]MCW3834658.1 hypothetical protein [Sphingomonas canadensis]
MFSTWDSLLKKLMAVLAVTCFLGWLFKAHCLGGGWTGLEQYTTGCYSDAVPFWTARGLANGAVPYLTGRMEYPVLTGILIAVEAVLARPFTAGTEEGPFLAMTALGNAMLAAVVMWHLWRAGMEPRRLWAWACAPALILYVGHNWDMLAVTFAVTAMLAARDGRLAKGAALGGLGLAAKLYPVLLLPLIGLQALANGADWPDRIRRGVIVTASAVGAWAAVNLPVALISYENWSEFYRFSSERSGTAASIWEITGMLGIWSTDIPQRNLYSAMLLVLGFAAIVGFGWRRHQAHLWVLFGPVLAWFLLVNKVYSPQFDLWLYPVLLMTAPRLRPVALFAVAGIACYFAEFWWFAGNEGGWPATTPTHIAIAAGVRGAAMLWIIADAIRLPPPAWIAAPKREVLFDADKEDVPAAA